MMTVSMLEDDRPIKSIIYDLVDAMWSVGVGSVTKIVIYPEPAEMGIAPWVALYSGDVIIQRMSLVGKRVIYQEEME